MRVTGAAVTAASLNSLLHGSSVKFPRVVVLLLLWALLLKWWVPLLLCKIAEAEAIVSVNEKKWLVMHVHGARCC
jgi:hypothetical protein